MLAPLSKLTTNRKGIKYYTAVLCIYLLRNSAGKTDPRARRISRSWDTRCPCELSVTKIRFDHFSYFLDKISPKNSSSPIMGNARLDGRGHERNTVRTFSDFRLTVGHVDSVLTPYIS